MHGVNYARFSSDNQSENSIEGQLRECKEFAEKNAITIVGNYIDRAYSAKTDARPQFQKMIKDSAGRLFEQVQEMLAKNKKAPARHKAEDDYLLTTKLYCGLCGAYMVGESGTSAAMKVHHYYNYGEKTPQMQEKDG